jgi:hypothetical protein
MAERDPSKNAEPQSQADRTLLGVAPPRLESLPDSALRSPVFVRSGTSVTDVEPPPLPRMALPDRSARPSAGETDSATGAGSSADWSASDGVLARSLRVARLHPALWMVLAPAVIALLAIAVAVATTPARKPRVTRSAAEPTAPARETPGAAELAAEKQLPTLAELEAKPAASLSASEILRLAEGKSQRRLTDAQALRGRVESNPALLADKPVQAELLRLMRDSDTAPEALAALSAVRSPLGADLLYEVWTSTPIHSESTELARALAFSADVRPRASAALSVALDLRAAQSCEQYQAILPSALKDGDRRSLAPLSKLANKRGCGPKKTDDCYACLRSQPDELTATINAVKSRRAPAYPSP